ncbi:AIPR family protein [Pedobacter insulae]|uniref:AIPR protein n=1 Tax=Pedobacter insulae TaxID=414048 RepID=A0A1I3ADD3_9SPHI|nr:AIPR family protein [Pedobacter insulae]SFH47729.1 AIPR protein [Pedobacter insulae]
MNNKELFINGYLTRVANQFPQSADQNQNINLAFEIFSISAFLDKPFQEVFDNILVKGSRDGGIDGIWFQDQGEYYVMHVFQCKNKRSLAANEIDKFRSDFRDIFTYGNKVGKQNIDDLKRWMDEYKQISEQGIVIETKLYFIFNGLNIDPDYANNQQIYETYNDVENDFLIVDSDTLYEKVADLSRQKRKEIKFTFHPQVSNISALDSQGIYTFAIQDIRAANFRIPATELCQLMAYEEQTNGSIASLFEENIRSFLGIKVRANKRMNETLNKREDAVYFPFLNNGITVICEQLIIPKSPQDDKYLLPITNPQIVNGLQTSWVLYNNYIKNPGLLKDIYVNIRIYETKDKTLVEKITDATNTQTPINYRDKISNKDFNMLTKEVFNNAGINYITKRGENFSKESLKFDDSIESETVIKYWFATFFEEPQTAKNSIASVLQKIFDASTFDKHPLEDLFDGKKESAVYHQLLTAYRIYRHVQNQKQLNIADHEVLAYADELMSYGIYKYLQSENDLNIYKEEAKLKEGYDDTLNVIEQIVEKDKQAHIQIGRTFSYNAYFKKPKSKVDFNNEKNILESDTLFEDLKNIR